MALEALCPICGAVLSLREDLQGKKVRCAKCEHVFTVGAEAKGSESKQSVQSKSAGPAPKKNPRDDEDDDRPRKGAARRGRDDDDEDDDRRAGGKKLKRAYHDDEDDDRDRKPKKPGGQVKRGAGKKSSGLPTTALVIAGATLVVLLLICGGGAWAMYAFFNGVSDVAQEAQNNVNNGFPVGGPGQPFGAFNDPKIANIDAALQELKKSAQAGDRQAAARWLSQQTTFEQGRQDEVARALDPLLAEPDVNSRFASMRALRIWATRENVPALVKALDDQKLEGVPNDANKDAMAALGRLKDGRGAAAVARYMTNVFVRDAAVEALKQMGPPAEKAVLKYYFDRDGGVREKARVLAQGYGTRETVIIAQAVEDVKQGTHRDARRDAAHWLKAVKVDSQQQKAVASTLEAALVDTDNEVADAAMDALDTWATADTVAALVKMVEDPTTGGRRDNMRRKALALLGKLKEVRGAEPVAARLTNGGDRRAAADALIAMGPVARPAVEKYITSSDQAVRREAERVLASYGADAGGLKITQMLADLASPEARRRSDAARALIAMKVDAAQQTKVAKALETAAANASDRGAQEQAVKALAVWGTKENGPTLIKIVEDRDKTQTALRHLAMDVLAKWKDENAIRPVALCIGPDRSDREAAGKALMAMGPDLGDKIEAVVKEGLKSTDKNVVLESVKVLGAVGTKASVASLNVLGQLALKQKKSDVARACETAILEIGARGK